MSSSTNQLVFAILQFLDEQQSQLSSEAAESLQVASECLENVFNVSRADTKYRLPIRLTELYGKAVEAELASRPPVSTETKAAAEDLKTKGNSSMKEEKYKDALECYSRAIDLDAQNAVYYSNRAAAYSKLNEHKKAIDDCQKALDIDSQYGKAYGRKGLAHTALSEHEAARDCYQRALALDANNESYKNNLEMAQKQLQEMNVQANPPSNSPFGGMDLSAIFNNPALMNMATTMMSNPQMQQMMAGMLPGGGAGGSPEGAPQGMEGLMQAGQQLAQQMQQANPDLVDQLRSQMRPPNNPDSNSGDGV